MERKEAPLTEERRWGFHSCEQNAEYQQLFAGTAADRLNICRRLCSWEVSGGAAVDL